jgi:hypothetical protein
MFTFETEKKGLKNIYRTSGYTQLDKMLTYKFQSGNG